MAKTIQGILHNVSFTPNGPGKYITNQTIYVNQSDMAGNGTLDIQIGYLVFAPLMDPGSGEIIPGVFERYRVSSFTAVTSNILILELDYDGEGLEIALPANGSDCLISQPTPNLRYGLAVSEDIYPTLPAGIGVGTYNQDLLQIADKNSGGTGSGLPDVTGQTGKYLYASPNPIWKKIEYTDIRPKFEILSFIPDVQFVEIGHLLENPTFGVSTSEIPSIVKLIDWEGSSTVVLDNGSVTSPKSYQLDSPGAIAITLEIKDAVGLTASKSNQLHWFPKIYFGTRIIMSDPVQDIPNLDGVVQELATGSYQVDAQPNEYIYFALPSTYPTPIFSVNGFQGGFTNVANNLQVMNTSGVVLSYNLYRSENHSLGSTKLVVL